MYLPAWTIWLQDDTLSPEVLKVPLAGLHEQGVSLEFYRRPGITLVRADGDDWEESSAAAQALARTCQCKVFHLWGAFGADERISAEAFTAKGAESWTVDGPEEPTGTRSFEAAYRRVHRELKLPGETPAVFLHSDAPFGVSTGWRKLAPWLTGDQQQAKSKTKSEVEKCVAALAAKARDDVAVVLVDERGKRLRAATHASIAARTKALKPKSLLLQKSPEASIKIWTHVEAFPFAVAAPPERYDRKELVKAVGQTFGKGVHVVHVRTTNRRDRDFKAFWLTPTPSLPGKNLTDLAPRSSSRCWPRMASLNRSSR